MLDRMAPVMWCTVPHLVMHVCIMQLVQWLFSSNAALIRSSGTARWHAATHWGRAGTVQRQCKSMQRQNGLGKSLWATVVPKNSSLTMLKKENESLPLNKDSPCPEAKGRPRCQERGLTRLAAPADIIRYQLQQHII